MRYASLVILIRMGILFA
ncbi:hypothetical protein LINPERHAP1_LOCUS40040 [Linum perenne]